MVDPRVPLIRARSASTIVDDGESDALVYDARSPRPSPTFSAPTACRRPARLTPATAERCSRRARPASEAAILANMEMWRWEPRDMGEERVEVNVPDFTLKVMEGDEVIHRARVIVGKPDTPTPIFSNQMKYMLINPAWRVPDVDHQEGDAAEARAGSRLPDPRAASR